MLINVTGLYRGYKTRNAQLDKLEASLPSFLATNPTPFANQDFKPVQSEDTLRELHDHLLAR